MLVIHCISFDAFLFWIYFWTYNLIRIHLFFNRYLIWISIDIFMSLVQYISLDLVNAWFEICKCLIVIL